MGSDYYRVLEVIPEAHPDVIRAAYRALANIYHPDRGGSATQTRALNDAFAILSDPHKRESYDLDRLSVNPKQIGNYKIQRLIAEGGFGKTYEAEHLLTGQSVCIKHCSRISPVDEEILVEEAKSIWDLRHYSIPVMRDLIKLDDGSLALVMSFIPGQTLAKIVETNGRLDSEHVAWIAERLINALKYLHYHGVVHGDVKPQNTILQPEDHTVVLVDFGLSLVKPTSRSSAKGYTQCFAPPEEIDGLPILPESDFYSLGMTMIYALNGGNLNRLERKEIPNTTPEPLAEFIRRLVANNLLLRPSWDKEDLCETISLVRELSFGRKNSGMKPLNYT